MWLRLESNILVYIHGYIETIVTFINDEYMPCHMLCPCCSKPYSHEPGSNDSTYTK